MTIHYRDPFVKRLSEDIAALITQPSADSAPVEASLRALVNANSPATKDYWRRTRPGMGVPDTAFKTSAGASPYLFADERPARTFRTSGTDRKSVV